MKRFVTLFCGALLLTTAAIAGDPGQAVADARAAIAAADYNRAVNVLHSARFDAERITDPQQRTDALGAIHFYSALAFTELGIDARGREELENFFELKPEVRSIDPARYPAAFVALFDEVRGSIGKRPANQPRQQGESFERIYPNEKLFSAVRRLQPTAADWERSPESRFLASDTERREFRALRDDAARSAFIERFWAKRDPDPATAENEVRETFDRNAAFADVAFAPDEGRNRGSLSDRANVFLLLGKPARVYVEPLNRARGAFLPSRNRDGLAGTVERWVYHKSQLPGTVPMDVVSFRFIDEPGYGDYVLQREFYGLKALGAAREKQPTE